MSELTNRDNVLEMRQGLSISEFGELLTIRKLLDVKDRFGSNGSKNLVYFKSLLTNLLLYLCVLSPSLLAHGYQEAYVFSIIFIKVV